MTAPSLPAYCLSVCDPDVGSFVGTVTVLARGMIFEVCVGEYDGKWVRESVNGLVGEKRAGKG